MSLSRKRAFTLIELLVVIAIVSLLAAILFPVFSRVRANAKRSSCQSNLRQLALGVTQYGQDYDERFPLLTEVAGGPGIFLGHTTASSTTWCDGLYPYVKSKNLFLCPEEKGTTRPHYAMSIFISQAFNKGAWDKSSEEKQFLVSDVARPSEVIMMSDCRVLDILYENYYSSPNSGDGDVRYVTFPGITSSTYYNDPRFDPVPDRHLMGANYAFFDGHVKWLQRDVVPGTTGVSTAYDRVPYRADANDLTIDWTSASVSARTKQYWRITQ